MKEQYFDFLLTKENKHTHSGFNIDECQLNSNMFDFQKYVTARGLRTGKYGIFGDTGTGKTLMELETAHQIVRHINKPVLILAPLGVTGQTILEGEKFGIEVKKFSGSYKPGIYITNYEQLNNIDTTEFGGLILDEASILKSFTGKYRNQIIDLFNRTRFKYPFTATPSPNDVTEICNYAEFLNTGRRTEILSEYFVHDAGSTQDWRLKGHGVERFYRFLNQWSVMFSKPSDLGFEQAGYDLPELIIKEIEVNSKVVAPGMLWNITPVSAVSFRQELRNTLEDRMGAVADVVNNSKGNFLIWVNLDVEGDMLRKLIPGSIEVTGSDKPEYKEEKLLGFGRNEFRVMITKPKIAGFGLNYQNCDNHFFPSQDFSFEMQYQCLRRSRRYGRLKPLTAWFTKTDTMANIYQRIKQKDNQNEIMRKLYIKYHERD
jgi:hypothetical protein